MFYETLLHITNPKTYIIVKKSIYFFDIFAINRPKHVFGTTNLWETVQPIKNAGRVSQPEGWIQWLFQHSATEFKFFWINGPKKYSANPTGLRDSKYYCRLNT